MTERYPSCISATDSTPDVDSPFPDPRAIPIEEPTHCPSSATHQQALLQHHYNFMADIPNHPNEMGYDPYETPSGVLTDGSAMPHPPTTSSDNSEFLWDHFSPAGSQGVPSLPLPVLGATHDQTNGISLNNQYTQSPAYSDHSNLQFQPGITYISNVQPTAPWIGDQYATQPEIHRISPRTDAHPPTPYFPRGSSLSTPDGSTRVPALSSGPSPSFSQQYYTPSSMSSFLLYTPDQNARNLESHYQPSPYTPAHTSSQQRPGGTLASCQVAQNAPPPSTIRTNQPSPAPNDFFQVSGYRKIAPVPPNYQKKSPSRPETKRMRRETKDTPRKQLDRSRESTTESFPAGTVVFVPSLTPTNVNEHSFNTSSRKVNEKIIAKAGVLSEAGYSIAPKVQQEPCTSNAPTQASTRAAEHTLARGPALGGQRRNSKETKGGGSMSAPRHRTSVRSPPARQQSTGNLSALGKRQKRRTTDSNSSSNSSKTRTGQSRTNSHEDQRLTTSSSQQTNASSSGRNRPARKNSRRVGGETSVAIPDSCTGLASPRMGEPSSRIPVLVPSKRAVGGRANPVGRALARPMSGSTKHESTSYRKGPTQRPGGGYQPSWEGMAARTEQPGIGDGAQQQVLPTTNQGDTHYPAVVDYTSFIPAQRLPEAENFDEESYPDYCYDPHNAAASRYIA